MLENLQPIHWVTDEETLKQLCQQWCQLEMIAVDTEFMRTNTYYPISALIQVNDGQANYLIDPLSIDDLSAFAALLQSPSVQKVLHSCSEDLEVFNHFLKCLPVNLYDTQVAAAFCGHGFTIGYAGLINAIMGIEIPKGETRSDWLQRPLTEAQVQYAALDVEFLFQAADILKKQLADTKHALWVSEECAELLVSYKATQDIANAIQRFKGAWRLTSRSVAALDVLSRWREQEAQKRNIPRNFVVKEKALYQIAESMPAQVSQFRKVDEFSEKSARRYGEIILELLSGVRDKSESLLPDKLPRPLAGSQKSLVKKMRETIQDVAEPLNIAPEYLARKKDYEHMARAVSEGLTGDKLFPETYNGWREALVKEPILAII